MPVTIQLRHFSTGTVDFFSHGEVVIEENELIVFLRHQGSREVLARYPLQDVATYRIDNVLDS